jgi:hypothetical protein
MGPREEGGGKASHTSSMMAGESEALLKAVESISRTLASGFFMRGVVEQRQLWRRHGDGKKPQRNGDVPHFVHCARWKKI